MTGSSEFGSHCRPLARELLAAQLATLDETPSLLTGALALSMHELDGVDVAATHATLQGWGDEIRRRAGSDQPRSRLAHAHHLLFEELGLAGNTDDYLDPRNSYVTSVLETRLGLPITLVLIYKVVLEHVGFTVQGISAPGHFLARVELDSGPTLIDPFSGGLPLSSEEAFERVEDAVGHPVKRDLALLKRTTNHLWLFRMLNNLEICFHHAGRVEDRQAMQELKAVLYRG